MKPTKYLDGLKEPHKEKIYKTFHSEVKVVDEIKRTLVVTISTPNVDRSQDTMNMKGMEYDNFIKNPVVLFAHKYDTKPIAKCLSLQITDKSAIATVEFTPKGLYDEADIIYEMYRQGFLNAWSIGFMPKDFDTNGEGGYNFKSWELFEFSSVPVPDNPEALTIMRSKGINVDKLIEKQAEVVEKGVISFKDTPKAPEDEAWDGSAEVKAATVEDLKIMCAWYDESKPDDKTSYKLPHHKAGGDHAVVWNGVKAAGGAVQGARNKLDVPEGDLAGIKSHLEKHYHQFDKKAPWEDGKDDEGKEDDGKTVNQENTETKEATKAQAKEELPAGDEDNPKDPGYTMDTKVTDLNVKQLLDVIDRALDAEEEENEDDTDGKSAGEVVKKDVQEVIALGYILDSLSWFISMFEANEVSQSSIDKLTSALGLVMQVVNEQAEMGKKSFNLAEFSDTKDTVKILAKAGRAISGKHQEMLEKACDHMDKAAEQVKCVMKGAEEQAPSEQEDDTLNSNVLTPVKDDGKGVKNEFLQKLANSLTTFNEQHKAVAAKQNKTLSLLEKIASGKGVK